MHLYALTVAGEMCAWWKQVVARGLQGPPNTSSVCWDHTLSGIVHVGTLLRECIQEHTGCMHSVCTLKCTEIMVCVGCCHRLETSCKVSRSLGIVIGDINSHS